MSSLSCIDEAIYGRKIGIAGKGARSRTYLYQKDNGKQIAMKNYNITRGETFETPHIVEIALLSAIDSPFVAKCIGFHLCNDAIHIFIGDYGQPLALYIENLPEFRELMLLMGSEITKDEHVFVNEEMQAQFVKMIAENTYTPLRGGKIDTLQRSTKHIMNRLAAGVKFLHSLTITHCDIKPQNIIIIGKGPVPIDGYHYFAYEEFSVKYIDFGNSCFNVPQKEPFEERRGSLMITPPEMILYGKCDGYLADVWALGITMLYLGGINIHQTCYTEDDMFSFMTGRIGGFESKDWPHVYSYHMRLIEQGVSRLVFDDIALQLRLGVDGIETLRSLLAVHPSKRLTASNICQLLYFAESANLDENPQTTILMEPTENKIPYKISTKVLRNAFRRIFNLYVQFEHSIDVLCHFRSLFDEIYQKYHKSIVDENVDIWMESCYYISAISLNHKMNNYFSVEECGESELITRIFLEIKGKIFYNNLYHAVNSRRYREPFSPFVNELIEKMCISTEITNVWKLKRIAKTLIRLSNKDIPRSEQYENFCSIVEKILN